MEGTKSRQFVSSIIIVLLLFILLLGANWLQSKFPQGEGRFVANNNQQLISESTETDGYQPRELPQGKATYIGTGGSAPYVTEVSLDPLDIKAWQRQAVEVKVNSPTTVQRVTVTIITDKGEVPHELQLWDGTNTDGTWRGSWLSLVSSGIRNYQAKVNAYSIDESSEVILTFR